jgi:hypothetical protein
MKKTGKRNIEELSCKHCCCVFNGQFLLRLDYGRSPHAYVNQRLQIQLELLMMNGVPLETCWAFNEVLMILRLSCIWLVLYSLLSSLMQGTMNLKYVTDDYYIAHAYCVLDTQGYRHTLRICYTYFFLRQQLLHERAWMLSYTYTACLVFHLKCSFCAGGKNETNEMGGTCGAYGGG